MSFSSAKRLGKLVIGYPETGVPVVSSVGYVTQLFESPASRVRILCSSLTLLTAFWILVQVVYSQSLPHPYLDYQLQLVSLLCLLLVVKTSNLPV